MSEPGTSPPAPVDPTSPTSAGAIGGRTIPTTCIETIGGDPDTALRLSFQIKVF